MEPDNGINFVNKRAPRGEGTQVPEMDRKSYLKQRIIDGAATEDEKQEFMSEHQEAPPAPSDVLDARTAFLVVLGTNGQAIATADLNAVSKLPEGMPAASLGDMYSGVCLAKRDIDANTAAMVMMQGLQQQAMAAQQAQQAQQQMNGARGMNLGGQRR